MFYGVAASGSRCALEYYAEVAADGPPLYFGAGGMLPVPNADSPEGVSRVEMTLEQACPPECWRAQCAFKDSMIH